MIARCLIAVLAVAAGLREAAAAPAFHAEPQVLVLEPAVNATASGTIVLRNDGPTAVVADSITAEPGCNTAAIAATPLAGFSLMPGEQRAITLTCAAQPASMQRCSYRVRSPAKTVLLELEAVCAYADTPALVPDPTSIDFGPVAIGSSMSRTVVVTNTSAAAIDRLFVETTDLAGNFTAAMPCNPDARECDAAIPAVPAGGATRVVVACTPRTEGAQTAQLYITTASGARLAAPIALSCAGAPATAPVLSVSTAVVDVGVVDVVNATATTTVHVTNTGNGMLKLLDMQVVDGGAGAASDWTAAPRGPCLSGISPMCVLTTGLTADIDLVFDPSAIAVRSAALLIHFRDTADRTMAIPLRGVGLGATLDVVGGHTILDFGTLPLAQTATLTLDIANRGTRDLLAGLVSVTPAGSPFATMPGSSFTAATGASTRITVTCKPTTKGIFAAVMHLAATDVLAPAVDIALRCAGDPDAVLLASPPAILLGEVRVGEPVVSKTTLSGKDAPVMLMSAALELGNPFLSLSALPPATTAALDTTALATADASLNDRIIVTPVNALPLPIAITGNAVTPKASAPSTLSLGTFCVQQPTTARAVSLTSTGTATISVSRPALQNADSPFDLELIEPIGYPATLAPQQRATVVASAKRRATAGPITDDVVWTTDASTIAMRTRLMATFVEDGGAIAPERLEFPDTPIHLDSGNAREVTLQNCSVSLLQLDPPQVPPPFSVDSPNFPSTLQPGEITIFTVGFHPTKAVTAVETLVITSPQLPGTTLEVMLIGTGTASGGSGDGGEAVEDTVDRTSFYACGSCASGGASGALVVVVAALRLIGPRRRRRSA